MYTGEKLGYAIRAAIKKKGVRQADVAQFFGVKQASVSGWLKHGRVAKEHIDKLILYFSDVVPPSHFGIESFGLINAPQNFGNGTQNNLINSNQTHISGSPSETPPTQIQQDDSMMPLIPQGSPLWADTADTALQNGKTYLIEYGGLQAVRRLFAVAGGQIRIKAHNPDYPEETLPAAQVRIIGRIVRWCVHD